MHEIPLAAFVFFSVFVPSVSACNPSFDNDCVVFNGPNVPLIAGLVIGISVLIFVVSFAWVCWRRQRIRRFQQNYVANAQYNASTVPTPFPTSQNQTAMYPMNTQPIAQPDSLHHHHMHHHHNAAHDAHHHTHHFDHDQNMMMQNQGFNAGGTGGGVGGVSGFSGT